ncbi:MAG: UDP-N-acetylmuramate dehydrogenase [Atopococcus tabaci]|uniref:UDP-N-acetylenolpyruvoylglucosamine reductase n=1 Tax=Atopococcus tabaci TaxID=269774 RepID=A0AA43UBT7_9LACT|nr:UDP-N-acetylmuramate dehydrogenase [Atopococcus tabaci]
MKIENIKQAFPNADIKLNESLSNYTYTKTGGLADAAIFPKNQEEVAAVIKWLRDNKIELTIIGNASNLIIRDGGIRDAVLILTDMDDIAVDGKRVTAKSGASIIDTSKAAYEAGLTGLEFSYGIPGSVGGAVYMNAGAYGGEVREVIETVTVLTREGNLKTYSNEEMNFDYRYSKIQESQDIILETTFLLESGKKDEIWEEMDELMALRQSKQPLEYPSCGSVFKRPPGYFAGKLIQDAGLQGKQIGGVQVSTKHAGFMVNVDEGTATDYIELIQYVQAAIKEKFNVILETEVRVIGEK